MLNPIEELMQREVPCSFHLFLVQFFITSKKILNPSDNFGTPLSVGISAIIMPMTISMLSKNSARCFVSGCVMGSAPWDYSFSVLMSSPVADLQCCAVPCGTEETPPHWSHPPPQCQQTGYVHDSMPSNVMVNLGIPMALAIPTVCSLYSPS
jgi:hypothetical protein